MRRGVKGLRRSVKKFGLSYELRIFFTWEGDKILLVNLLGWGFRVMSVSAKDGYLEAMFKFFELLLDNDLVYFFLCEVGDLLPILKDIGWSSFLGLVKLVSPKSTEGKEISHPYFQNFVPKIAHHHPHSAPSDRKS